MTTTEQVNKFWEDGFCVIPDIISESDVEMLKTECQNIVDEMDPKQHNVIFLSGQDQIGCDDYFLTSGDKIRFFFEKDVFNSNGKLVDEKLKCLNKIGHALHWLSPAFKKVTFCDKMKTVARNLKLVDPVIAQGMYIFKNPRIGAAVVPHQDATYLHTEPLSNVYGMWIALEDAHEENGCLYFIPGSHKDGNLHQRFIRNDPGQMPLTQLVGDPISQRENEFVPVPVKKGSGVIIHGLAIHKSKHNSSEKSRPIYTFHILDQGLGKWSSSNWLQPTKALPFPSLYRAAI